MHKRRIKPNPIPASVDRSQIMTLQQVALYLGLHYLTIYRLIQGRKIPAAKVGGSWRFKKDVIDRWLETDMDSHYGESDQNHEDLKTGRNA